MQTVMFSTAEYMRPYPGSQETSSQIEASVSTETPIGIESMVKHDQQKPGKNIRQRSFEDMLNTPSSGRSR
jgi:hypothetical protein